MVADDGSDRKTSSARDSVNQPDATPEIEREPQLPDDLPDAQEGLSSAAMPKVVGERHFKEFIYSRLGFYLALDSESPSESLEFQLQLLKSEYEDRAKRAAELSAAHSDFAKAQIDHYQSRFNEEHATIDALLAQVQEVRIRRSALEEEIRRLAPSIRAEQSKLAEKKSVELEHRFAKRLEEMVDELEKVIDSQQLLAKRIHDARKKTFDEHPEVYESRRARIERRRECAERSYAIVCEKIAKLASAGLTMFSLVVMQVVGWAGVAASGWFYSVFVVETKNLRSEDYISFTLKRAITFIQNNTFVYPGENVLLSIVVLIAGWVAFLAVATIVVWLCDVPFRRKETESDSGAVETFTPDEERVLLKTDPRLTRRAMSFWFEALPYVFVVGAIMVILAKFGTPTVGGAPPTDLDTLLDSLSGKFIGASITLVLTGIAMIYVSFVIEPRLLGDQLRVRSPLRDNWELAVLVLLFVSVMATALVHPDWGARSIAVASYSAIALLTAFTLAYCIRFLGCYYSERRWDKHILRLSYAMEFSSRARPLDLSLLESREFRQKFKDSVGDLTSIIRLRNDAVRTLYDDQVAYRPAARLRVPMTLARLWPSLFGVGRNAPGSSMPDVVITHAEELLFPEHVRTIASLCDELKAKELDLEQLSQEIEKREIRMSDRQSIVYSRMDELKAAMDLWKRESIRIRERLEQARSSLDDELKIVEVHLRTGQHLAPWYDSLKPHEHAPYSGEPSAKGD
jgi:hypothetical protein